MMLRYHLIILAVTLLFSLELLASSGEEDEGLAKREMSEDKKQKMRDQFGELVIKGILKFTQTYLDTHPVVGRAFKWLFRMTGDGIGGDSPWDRMEHKVERTVRTIQTDKHLNDLGDDWNFINYRLLKSKSGKFDKTDFADIRSKYPKFFPQQNDDIVYSIRWPLNLIRYLTVLNAVYIEYMASGLINECAWAEQLKIFKRDVIMAVKALAKARYRELDANDWHGGVHPLRPAARLSFIDTSTGTAYSKILLDQVQREVIYRLEDKTRDELYENLVRPFNLLFNESWTPASCDPPSQIKMHQLPVDFPRRCMDAGDVCTYPCGYYGKDFRWCSYFKHHMPTNQYGDGWVENIKKGRRSYERVIGWKKCDPPNWDTCIRISKVKPIKWTEDDVKKN